MSAPASCGMPSSVNMRSAVSSHPVPSSSRSVATHILAMAAAASASRVRRPPGTGEPGQRGPPRSAAASTSPWARLARTSNASAGAEPTCPSGAPRPAGAAANVIAPVASPRASRSAAAATWARAWSSNWCSSATASSIRPCRSRRSAIRAYASAATCGPGPSLISMAVDSSRSPSVPAAGRHEQAAVDGPAARVQERAAVLADEPVRHLAPPRGPLEVVGQIAGDEHVAAGEDHGVQPGALAAERAGHRLVDERRAPRPPRRTSRASRRARTASTAPGPDRRWRGRPPAPARRARGASARSEVTYARVAHTHGASGSSSPVSSRAARAIHPLAAGPLPKFAS